MMSPTDLYDRTAFAEALERVCRMHPDAQTVEMFTVSLNGVVYGKHAPLSTAQQMVHGSPVPFQTSLLGLDAFCSDVAESAIAMEVGDPDGTFLPIPSSLAAVPWSPRPTLQLQGMLSNPDGNASAAFDPRAVLQSVLHRAGAMGFVPTVALELEFYLIDPVDTDLARHPRTGARLTRGQIMDLDVMRAFEPVLTTIQDYAAALGAPTSSMLAEFGPGQFEINLMHGDALVACDQMVALKRAIRAAAQAHSFDATFMAKPFSGLPGSGMHMHLSLSASDGRNVFDAPDHPVGATLGAAIAGCLARINETFLIMAPHLNSYRRHRRGSYAPVGPNWGTDNRGAAVRVPATKGPDARLEHRVAGADANPYLLAAAVLSSALEGIEHAKAPPAPTRSEAPHGAPPFPGNWDTARHAFEESAFVADFMGSEFRRIYSAIKRQETAKLLDTVTDVEQDLYLRAV